MTNICTTYSLTSGIVWFMETLYSIHWSVNTIARSMFCRYGFFKKEPEPVYHIYYNGPSTPATPGAPDAAPVFTTRIYEELPDGIYCKGPPSNEPFGLAPLNKPRSKGSKPPNMPCPPPPRPKQPLPDVPGFDNMEARRQMSVTSEMGNATFQERTKVFNEIWKKGENVWLSNYYKREHANNGIQWNVKNCVIMWLSNCWGYGLGTI